MSGIKIEPAYSDITLKPGEEKAIAITLRNDTDSSLNFALSTQNFQKKTGHNSISLLPETSGYSYSLASYLSLKEDSIIIEPNKSEIIEVVVRDRQDLSPGGHYGAVIAQLSEVNNDTVIPNKETHIYPALTSLILLRKEGGEHFNLSLKYVNWPNGNIQFTYPKTITLEFQNEGNVHVIPRGRIEIHDIFGRFTHKAIINTASTYIFPSSRDTLKIELNQLRQPLPITFATIKVSGTDSLHRTSFSYHDTFVYINPYFIVAFVICNIALIMLFKRFSHTTKIT